MTGGRIMTTWPTEDDVREEWADAAQVSDAVLPLLLASAIDAVVAYAPALRPFTPTEKQPDQPIPERYRLAVVMQVRNLWSAVDVKPDGNLGGDTFTYTPRPLDWHVKALLRPPRGRPRVG